MDPYFRRCFCGLHANHHSPSYELGWSPVLAEARFHGRSVYLSDLSGSAAIRVYDRPYRNTRHIWRVRVRINHSQRRRICTEINKKDRRFRYRLASAALLRFKRIEDGRGENTGSEGVGAVGVGDIDGVRGEDTGDVCSGNAVYDAGEGIFGVGRSDEY